MTRPQPRVLGIHRDPVAVARNHLTRGDRNRLDDLAATRDPTTPEFVAMVNAALPVGLRVEEGVAGTTAGRPWALVAPRKEADS